MREKCFRFLKLVMLSALGICMVQVSFGATEKADSLQRVISDLPDNEQKADHLRDLGQEYYLRNSYDSAAIFYKKSAELSMTIGYREGLADAWYWMSNVNYRTLDYTAAQELLDQYLDLCSSLQDSARLGKGYFQQARIYKDQNKYNLALHYCRQSLAIYLPLKHELGIYANYNVLGSIFVGISEYDSAAVYYLKAIEICEKEGNERNLAILYGNLTEVFIQSEQYEKAGKYTTMALEINEKYPENRDGLASSHMDLGRIMAEQGQYLEALNHYDLALKYYQEANDLIGKLNAYNNYGDLFFRQKKFSRAIQYFEKALDGYQEIGYLQGIVTALGNKAAAFAESGRYSEALTLYDSCLEISFREGNRELRKDIYWNISNSSQKAGDFRRAYEYLELYSEIKDSLFNLKRVELINELDIIYEKEKVLAQNKILENENLKKDLNLRKRTSQRNAFLFTGLAIIAVGIFIILYLRQRAAKDKIIAQQRIRQLEEEKKLMAAKLLVEGQEEERKRIARELHDGLGVLLSATKMQFTSIRDKSPENSPLIEKATQLLEQASGDVRKISHNMMPGLLTKLGLYEAVEDLIDNLNDTEDLEAVCEITGNHENRLPENQEIMLYRIVQEMVNNTLKHARAKNISLKMKVFPTQIHIIYTDDGKGFDVKKVLESETQSLGLKSIQSRVSFLNGEMQIESEPGKGVRYSIQVPV